MEKIHAVCPNCQTVNAVLPDRILQHPVCAKCATPLLPSHPVDLTDQTFDRFVSRSGLPVLVDFWAPWCGPCRQMAPAFAQAAARLEPRVRLAKVDTDAEPALASRFGIRSIPTLIAFRHGREIARRAGALDAASLQRWIDSLP